MAWDSTHLGRFKSMIIPYEPDYFPPAGNMIARLGRNVLLFMRNTGRGVQMTLQAFAFIPLVYKSREEICRQMFVTGVKSLGVTSTVALFTGMILALQSGLILRSYGQETKVGYLVAQTMFREMGPFMTALILAASVGSAMAAEIGTMAVSQEIAALDVMSINPVRFLVMPRLVALMLTCPVLTAYTNFIGIIGGGFVANTQLDVSWALYFENVRFMLYEKEIWVGMLKAIVFAIIVVAVSCYEGMAAKDGAVGVGRATRHAVVTSFLLVLITGYMITRLFY